MRNFLDEMLPNILTYKQHRLLSTLLLSAPGLSLSFSAAGNIDSRSNCWNVGNFPQADSA